MQEHRYNTRTEVKLPGSPTRCDGHVVHFVPYKANSSVTNFKRNNSKIQAQRTHYRSIILRRPRTFQEFRLQSAFDGGQLMLLARPMCVWPNVPHGLPNVPMEK